MYFSKLNITFIIPNTIFLPIPLLNAYMKFPRAGDLRKQEWVDSTLLDCLSSKTYDDLTERMNKLMSEKCQRRIRQKVCNMAKCLTT